MNIKFDKEAEELKTTFRLIIDQAERGLQNIEDDVDSCRYEHLKSPGEFNVYCQTKIGELIALVEYYKSNISDLYNTMETYRETY